MKLEAVHQATPLVGAEVVGQGDTKGADPGFEATLGKMVENANADHMKAERAAESLARGASDDLHGTMISMKEAEISLKLVGTVRNKLLDAFHELWRINV